MTNSKNRHLNQSQMLHFLGMGYGIMTASLQKLDQCGGTAYELWYITFESKFWEGTYYYSTKTGEEFKPYYLLIAIK